MRDRTGLDQSNGRIRGLREFREHGAARRLEEIERGREDSMLELRILGLAQSITVWKGHEERSRRLCALRVLLHQDQSCGGKSAGLERSGKHTDRVRAVRSGRRENRGIRPFIQEKARNGGPSLIHDFLRVRLGAHKGIVIVCG